MQPSMQLFYLVKSLDASEVRYVRAFAKRKDAEGSASLGLFDLIYHCTVYDEKKFAETVKVANFPALKIYVRDLIADAILEKDLKKKGIAEIVALIGQIEIFHKKGFMQLMWGRMEKALLLCEKYEAFSLWRDLLQKKQNILMADSPVGHTPEGLAGFDEIYEAVKLKAKNIEEFRDLEDRVVVAPRKGSQAMFDVATLLMAHPMLAVDAPRLSMRAEIKYCSLRRIILRWTNQYSESLHFSERIVELLDQNRLLLLDEDLSQIYLNRLSHNARYAAAMGDFERATMGIARIKTFTHYPILVFEKVPSIELRIAMQLEDIAKGQAIVEEVETGFKTHQYRISHEVKTAYCFQIAHFYLHFSEAKKALRWVLQLRDLESAGFKKDLQDFGEILFLLCHFDLGNFDFLKVEARKVVGHLQKRSALTAYEEAIAKGIRLAAIAKTESSRQKRLKTMLSEIETLASQAHLTYKRNYFHFPSWINAKLAGAKPSEFARHEADRLKRDHPKQ